MMIVMEALDLLMNLIPARIWDRLWRDAVETRSGELAEATDIGIRVGLVLCVVVLSAALWMLV